MEGVLRLPWWYWMAGRLRRPLGAVLVAAAVGVSGASIYVTTQGGGGGAGAAWAGTFDCYGSTPSCTGLSPATCTSTLSSGGSELNTALNSATGGEVFCLNTTTAFSTVTLSSKNYSSVVTVQPTAGVAANLARATLNAVGNLRITGVGASDLSSTSLTVIAGVTVQNSGGCSHDVTVDHVIFNGATLGLFGYIARTDTTGCTNMDILWDHNRYDHGSEADTCEQCRFYVDGNSTTGGGTNVTVSNSHFDGSPGTANCADGVYVDGGRGAVVGPGNEFVNFHQTGCTYHSDPMSGFTSNQQTVTGNFFHDNTTSAGGSLLSDREPNLTFKNNVVLEASYYSYLVKGPDTNTITHNYVSSYLAMDEISNEGTWGGNNLIRNNVFADLGNRNTCVAITANTSYTADHNMIDDTSNQTGCDSHATPILVGSGSHAPYYNYELASNSPGYNAGSDGKSLGICSTCG